MTSRDWANKYAGLGAKVRNKRVLFFATTATMVSMTKRIWSDGKFSNGSKLTYKNNYEVWAYKPPSPRAVSGKGKTGKAIKGGWYPSYGAYKEGQGRGNLPFELTGDFRISWAGGATPTPREKNPLLCVISMPQDIADRVEGLERQKGAKIIDLSSEERSAHAINIGKAYRELVLNQQ